MPGDLLVTVIVAAITAAGGVGVALVELVGKLKELTAATSASAKATNEVKAQVVNSHSTNLRDDLDQLRLEVLAIRRDARAEHRAIWQAMTGAGDLPTAPTKVIRPESTQHGQAHRPDPNP